MIALAIQVAVKDSSDMGGTVIAMYWVWTIVIGILAGWLAGKIMRGKGFGLVVDLLLGIVGAILGGRIFALIGLAAFGLIGRLIVALVGALLFLWLVRAIKRA